MQRLKSQLLIASVVLCAGTFASGQFYSVPQGRIDGISDNGVGAGSAFGNTGQYFRWTVGGGAVGIGGVSPGNGVGGEGEISRDGRYISGTTFNDTMGYHEMSRYDSDTGAWSGFGLVPVIGQQVDSEVSSGWGVSGDGLSVVGLGWTTEGTADTHAFQWTEGVGAIDLGSATVGNSARGTDLNLDGSVAVGWQDGGGRQGAAWVNGVQELIFDGGGNVAQEATAVSGDGQWVTGFGIGSPVAAGQTYRYNTATDTHESIPNLDVGGQRFWGGSGITDDGKMIVGGTWGFGPATFGNAIIWQDGIGTMLMADYLTDKGVVLPANANLAFASSISSDGQWIAGWSGPGSGSDSWVVQVPEPATGGLMLLALAAIGFVRRRVA